MLRKRRRSASLRQRLELGTVCRLDDKECLRREFRFRLWVCGIGMGGEAEAGGGASRCGDPGLSSSRGPGSRISEPESRHSSAWGRRPSCIKQLLPSPEAGKHPCTDPRMPPYRWASLAPANSGTLRAIRCFNGFRPEMNSAGGNSGSVRAALWVKEVRRRGKDLIIGYPGTSLPTQGLPIIVISARDLVHLNTENAFEWWYALETGNSKSGWRFAAVKYARTHLKAFVVHDDCSITAFRNECCLTFVREKSRPHLGGNPIWQDVGLPTR